MKSMDESLYWYRGVVVSVYDGDTLRADIDLGLSIWVRNEKLRLLYIDAPELRGDELERGRASRDFLREQVLGKEVRIRTKRDRKGKYGRYLAEIWLPQPDGSWLNVNELMVEAGYADYF